MMLRKTLLFIVALVLFGCASSGPSIVGTWESTVKGASLTLTAKPDSSFTIQGASQFAGKWESSGGDVRLFRDIRNGGDLPFGEGGDGAMHFQLSADGKQMDGKAADGTPFQFKKK